MSHVRVFLAFNLVAFALVAFTVPAAANDDQNCRDFATRALAQAHLDADPSDPDNIDTNNNGIACEDFLFPGETAVPVPTSVPTAIPTPAPTQVPDLLNCRDFPTRAAAQAALDADPSDPNNIDTNDNGIACEDFLFAGETAVPTTPAPTKAPGAPVPTKAPAPSGGTTTLPNTGAGPESGGPTAPILAIVLLSVAALGLFAARRHRTA